MGDADAGDASTASVSRLSSSASHSQLENGKEVSQDRPYPQHSSADSTSAAPRKESSKSDAAINASTDLGRGDVVDYLNSGSAGQAGSLSCSSPSSPENDAVPESGVTVRQVVAFDTANIQVPLLQHARRQALERSYSAVLHDAASRPGRVKSPVEGSTPVATSPSLSSHTRHYLGPESIQEIPDQNGNQTYLFPTLTDCERQRLNRLWYITKGIEDDTVLREQLTQLASIARETTGYGIAIVGLLDNDAFVRIAAKGVPLAVISRREATCSHTVLEPPGTVFSLPDMFADDRFKHSAPVKMGGLRSYAGTSMLYELPDTGQKFPMGSLCVADYAEQTALTESQQAVLVKLAAAAMNTILNRSYTQRQSKQGKMQQYLAQLSEYQLDSSSILKKVSKVLESVFPGDKISFIESSNGVLGLDGGIPVAYTSLRSNLWENTEFFERFITEKNHISSRGKQNQSVRAIAVDLPRSDIHYFVVETADLRQVYDETDVMFVRSCAMIACNGLQAGLLRKALDAKVSFLRSVQHSFRTSLNGILSASEMLLDEDKMSDGKMSERSSRQCSAPSFSFSKEYQPDDAARQGSALTRLSTASTVDVAPLGREDKQILPSSSFHRSSPPIMRGEIVSPPSGRSAKDDRSSLINIIDTSGRALLTVINNLIHFDASSQVVSAETDMCNLYDVEEEVLNSVLSTCSFQKQTQVLLQVVAHDLPEHIDVVMTDEKLLRQALTALVQNAMDNTETGSVQLSSYINDDTGSLVFDIKDTGCGIPPKDIDRIFQPFEKVHAYSPNAGLGLTFAARYAAILSGSVSIVTTAVGQGTVMRLNLPHPVFACTQQRRENSRRFLRWKYYIAESSELEEGRQLSEKSMVGIAKYLELAGLKRTDNLEEARIILVDTEESRSHCAQRLERTPRHVFVTILPLAENYRRYLEYNPDDRLFYLGLPLCRSRVAACLEQARAVFQQYGTQDAVTLHSMTAAAEWTNAVAAAADTTSSRMSDTSDAPPLQTLQCLLVDDNDTNLSILQKYCVKRSFGHEIARDGNEAFEQYRRSHQQGQSITCCLMDLQMPHCDGIQSTLYIRNYEKEHGLRPSKIFMVSGQSGDEERSLALAAGCDGYYVKPLRIKALDELLAVHFHI